jgi:hypothetical protein
MRNLSGKTVCINRETPRNLLKGNHFWRIEHDSGRSGSVFEMIPKNSPQSKTIQDVGLGYITLGQQSSTTLGGVAQRIKLAGEFI